MIRLLIMLSGKLFQSVIALGKKLFWKYVVDVDGGMYIM